jgi:NTE family protein
MGSADANEQLDLGQALEKLFETDAARDASWITLPGGSFLFSEGDESDHLYLLRSGRLGVFRHNEDGKSLTLYGIIRPGDPVGEMSLIADTPHSATVMALRDCELLALPRAAFLSAIERVPDVLLALSRKMIERARQKHPSHAAPNVFALFALNEVAIKPIADDIARAVSDLGYSAIVLDDGWLGSTPEDFSRLEAEYDYVLYAVEKNQSHWGLLTSRQVDHTFLLAEAAPGPAQGLHWQLDPMGHLRAPDLVLLHPRDVIAAGRISGTRAWLDAIGPARHFHISPERLSDAQRLARLITGHSTGLVFSGGGARAFAHIGAIQALREAHIPLDFACGASMGGIIAATVALEWSQDEIDAHIQAAFVASSPLDDVTFPLLAMTSGKKVDERLKAHFGEVLIEDLPLPFFCVSSNLTTGEVKTHRTGLLRAALRASISLPGIMPPVIEDGHVLVDGAVMRSFPARMMRHMHLGTVIGVDVTRARGLDPASLRVPDSLPKWLLRGHWRQGPPIVSILMRSATITTASDLAESRRATDLLVIPEPDGVEIRDWHAYDLAVENGYATTVSALSGLMCPVTMMRKLGQTHHPDIPAFTPDDSGKHPRPVKRPLAEARPRPKSKAPAKAPARKAKPKA